MRKEILFFALCLCLGCNSVPEDYQQVIDKAGSNREELLKVVAHYDSIHQPEKREAAYYLIGSMYNKYIWTGDVVTSFDTLFHYMDSLYP